MSSSNLDTLKRDWGNYWQGRTAANAGSALVGIENHPEIRRHWDKSLNEFSKDISTLDMACGAGTVAKVLSEKGFSDITGLDISSAAIKTMREALPLVKGVVSPADSTPFDAEQFDLIVSQYGFEYGDYESVIPEIARILKPGASFIALSHKSGGGIHKEVSEQLAETAAIKDSGFIPLAKQLFAGAMGQDKSLDPAKVGAEFRPAQMRLLGLAKTHKGLAEHLYVNTQMMFKERSKYHFEDIMKWFDGMNDEVERFIGRMSSMKSASIDDDKMASILSVFEAHKIVMRKPEPLIDDQDEALGWIIHGQKID